MDDLVFRQFDFRRRRRRETGQSLGLGSRKSLTMSGKGHISRTEGSQIKKYKTLWKEMCNIAKLKKSRSLVKLKSAIADLKTRYGSLRSISRRLHLSWGEMQTLYLARDYKKEEEEYTRKLGKELKESMKDFFLEGAASFPLPGAANKSKVFLNRPLREACELFNVKRGSKRTVGVSTFAKHRPKKVKLQRSIPLSSCLCEVCTNFKLKCKALIAVGIKNIYSGGRKAVSETVCAYKHLADHPDPSVRIIGSYGYRDCIFRKCQECGVRKMKEQIELTNQEILHENKKVEWCVWESVDRKMKKGDKVKMVKRVEKVTKNDCLKTLVELYLKDLERLSSHLFFARFQYDQVTDLQTSLPKGVLLCSHDYAQNINCYAQQQVQGGYFDQTLVTLHPSVVHFACGVSGCQKKVRLEIIHLSKILKHNASAFNQFNIHTVNIAEKVAQTNFKLIINSSDGAPSQYKNRNSFMYSSRFKKPLIHFFLGNRHGKHHSDQAAGRFAQWLRRQITTEKVHVSCARDIAKHAEKHYATTDVDCNECQHFRIKINLVKRIPPIATASVTVEHTRDIHMLRNVGNPGVILTRNIGCLCMACISGNGTCKYPEYFCDWTRQNVSKDVPVGGIDPWPLELTSNYETVDAVVGTMSESTQVFGRSTVDFDVEVGEQFVEVTESQIDNSQVSGSQHSVNQLTESQIDNSQVSGSQHSVNQLTESQIDNSEVSASQQRVNQLPMLYGVVKSWDQVVDAIKKCKSFIELEILCTNLQLPPLQSTPNLQYDQRVDVVHALTSDLLQSVNIVIPESHVPVDVTADGNCLPRSLSRIVYGSERNHLEIRVRLVLDGVLNKTMYLNNANLKVGSSSKVQDENFVQRYCRYSDNFDTCRALTKRTVERFYESEWYEYRRRGVYSGIFQLHSAANVLQMKVESYYPSLTFHSVHVDLHRSLFPLGRHDEEDLETCHIVWTKSCLRATRLQHLVPLVETAM